VKGLFNCIPPISISISKNKVSLDEILLFFLLLFGPLAHGLVETWSITTALLTVLSLVSIAVLTRIHKGELRFYRTPADIPIFLFLIAILISYCISVYPYASRIIIYKGLAGLALFFYIVNTQRSHQKINLLLWVIVILGTMYAVMGLTLIDGDILGFKIYSQKRYNISLFYVNYNHFAGYLELVFCLSVGLAAASKGGKRILLFGMTVLIAAAALFTLSRGGIIGLTGGLAFFIIASAFMQRQKKDNPLLFSAVVIGLIIITWFGLDPVLERLSTLDDLSVAGEVRMQVWRDTLRMIYDRPFFGWGPDTFSVAFPAYQTQGFDQKFVNYAHNDYLELAADTGILGLTAFLVSLLSLYFFCLKNLKKVTYNRYWQNIGIGALAACFSILIHSVTDCNLQVPANLFFFATAAGIAAVAASKSRQKKGACINIKLKSPIRKNIAFMNCGLVFCASATIILLPFFGERAFKTAKTSLRQKKYDDAILKIDRALLLNPDNAAFLSLKANILLTKKIQTDTLPDIKNCTGCDKIEKWHRKACAASPTNSSYLIKKAAFFERYKMTPAARKAYAKAIRLSPMYAPTYYHMAVLSLRQRQFDDALKYFNIFLKLSGEKELNKVINDIWSAGGDYETQKRAVPETASFRQAFARYLATDGENESAAQEAVFAFSLEPTVRNALMHLNLLWDSKDFESSLTASEEYLKQFPGELQIKERYAATLEKLNRYQEAVFVYRQLINKHFETRKNYEKYFIRIARLYAKQKLYSEAVAVLELGIKKYPRTGRLYYSMGIYLRAMKKNEEALTALKKSVTLNPDNISFRYQLGEEYRRHELELEALREWKECLSIKSNFPPCKKGIETIQKKFNFFPINGPTKKLSSSGG
jgi:O-antigen ligase